MNQLRNEERRNDQLWLLEGQDCAEEEIKTQQTGLRVMQTENILKILVNFDIRQTEG